MKRSFVVAAAAILYFLPVDFVEAGKRGVYQQPTVNFLDNNLFRVDSKTVNCDELVRISKQKEYVVSAGQIIVGDALSCSNLASSDYDFFQSKGAYIRVSDKVCNVWSCTGVISGSGRD